LGLNLLHLYTANLVELHVHSPPFVPAVSELPVASPLARLQAAAGAAVTNLRHERILVNELDRQLLRHLDGSRDRAALLEVLTGLAEDGLLAVQEGGQPVRDRAGSQRAFAPSLDQSLSGLARKALLAG